MIFLFQKVLFTTMEEVVVKNNQIKIEFKGSNGQCGFLVRKKQRKVILILKNKAKKVGENIGNSGFYF